MSTSFSTGRKWLCTPKNGRARFWFVILGPGDNYAGKPSKTHKLCRLDVHPDDRNLAGGNTDGRAQTYSHAHIKKYGVLVPEDGEVTPNGGTYHQVTRSDGLEVTVVVPGPDEAE